MRDFCPADQAAVRALVLEGLRERWGESFDPAFNPDLDAIMASYVEVGSDVVVWEREAKIVGVGVLVSEGETEGRLLRISVVAANRREGLASSIVHDLVDRVHRRGLARIRVLTDTP